MNQLSRTSLHLVCVLSSVCVAQVSTPSDSTASPAQQTSAAAAEADIRYEGFWPTERLTRSLIGRWAQQVGDHYELRPDQYRQVENHLTGRWPSFLTENRSELQPLLNEYLEIRMAMTPPTAEQVSEWSARAMPVFQRVRHHLEVGQQQFRGMLTASQQSKFDQDRTKMVLGLGLFESKLRQWSVGNYELDEWWDKTPQYRKQQAERERQQSESAAHSESVASQTKLGGYPPRVATELGAWELHVANFCDTYQLDRSQRNAAQSILREMLDRADNHVRLNRHRIMSVERIIEGNEQVDQPEVDAELKAVYGPIDFMFTELDERILRLPTDAQLRRVGLEEGYDSATTIRDQPLPQKTIIKGTPQPTSLATPAPRADSDLQR